MTPTPTTPPALLTPERLAEIVLNVKRRQLVANQHFAGHLRVESQETADMLAHITAYREQVRQALAGLAAACEVSEANPLARLEGTPRFGWSRECYCSGQQQQLNRMDALIRAAAAALGLGEL